jgi:VanZ family protein
VWAVLIFCASTQTFSSQYTSQVLGPILRRIFPATTQEQVDVINFLIRKFAHFAEYFVFYLLVYRGLSGVRKRWRWSWGLGAWVIAAVYSALDEFHQSFVISRTASPWDSLLDSTGAFVALLALFLVLRYRASHSTT